MNPYVKIEKAHLSSIESVCFNPNNEAELVTGGHDKLIKLWDINKCKTSGILSGHKEGVWVT